MIKFHKVTFEQWSQNKVFEQYHNNIRKERVHECQCRYDDIKLPQRATIGSAGYDIYSTIDTTLEPGETVKLPLGIRVEMDIDVVLFIVPRSGLGFKYKFQLDNTIGVIDSDYFYSDNEGHIWGKFTNNGKKPLEIHVGDAICQGIFVNYLVTEDDNVEKTRNGGLGSTSK